MCTVAVLAEVARIIRGAVLQHLSALASEQARIPRAPDGALLPAWRRLNLCEVTDPVGDLGTVAVFIQENPILPVELSGCAAAWNRSSAS